MGTRELWVRESRIMSEHTIPVMGAPQSMRDGIHACRLDRSVVHPVQAIETGAFRQAFEAKTQEMSAIYGSHMAMRMQMENAILSRHQRLPGLKSNFVGLSALHNTDEDFGFEDVLDVPDIRESMPVAVHEAMETKLRL